MLFDVLRPSVVVFDVQGRGTGLGFSALLAGCLPSVVGLFKNTYDLIERA